MTSTERANVRYDMALIQEKLHRVSSTMEAGLDATAREYAEQIAEVATRIAATAGAAVERTERERRDAAA